MIGLVYGVLTPLATLFQYRGGQFYLLSTNLSQVIDKHYHIMLYRTGFELTTLVMIGTDFTGTM